MTRVWVWQTSFDVSWGIPDCTFHQGHYWRWHGGFSVPSLRVARVSVKVFRIPWLLPGHHFELLYWLYYIQYRSYDWFSLEMCPETILGFLLELEPLWFLDFYMISIWFLYDAFVHNWIQLGTASASRGLRHTPLECYLSAGDAPVIFGRLVPWSDLMNVVFIYIYIYV